MDLPIELLIDYMGYLNPDVRLKARGGWVKGIKLMPETGRLDTRYLYLAQNGTPGLADRGVPLVIVCRRGEEAVGNIDDCIILHTDMPMVEVFNELLGTQNLIRSWEQDLELSISRREGVQRLLDISGRVFGNPTAVITTSFKTIAATWDFETDDLIFRELLELGYLTQESFTQLRGRGCFDPEMLTGEVQTLPPAEGQSAPSIMAAVTHDGAVGFLVIMLCSNTKLSPGLEQLFGVFIDKLQYYLKPAVATGDYIKNQFDYFIVDIIEGRISTPQGIMERALVYPPAYTAEYNTVLIAHENTGAMYLEHAMQNLSAIFPNVRQILYNGNIILHPDLGEEASRREHFMSMLGDYLDAARAYAGISETVMGLETLRTSYEQALTALNLGRQLRGIQRVESFLSPDEPAARFFRYRDYHVYDLLSGKRESTDCLSDIRRWDMEHGTDYYRILFVLLSLERSFTKAAEVLHMHRNNVIYHAKRISEQFHLDLEDPNVRLRLLMLYRAAEMTEAGI